MTAATKLDDQRWWPEIEAAWTRGRQVWKPEDAPTERWRSSARRLARSLKVSVRTFVIRDGESAIALIEYPLGMDDEDERRRYDEALDRHAADVIGEIVAGLYNKSQR